MTTIDEDWLAEALHGLGEMIDVPSDGPARVLAARPRQGTIGGVDRPGHHRRWTRIATAAALASVALLVFGLVAIRVSRRAASSTNSLSVPASQAPASSATGGVAGPINGALGPLSAGPAGPTKAVPSPPAVLAPALATKVVKSGSVEVQLGHGKLSAAVEQLTSLTSGLGGYVADTKTAEGAGSPTAALTLRVPVNAFETLVSRSRALGKPTAVSTSGQDVTAAAVDLDARIQALQDTRTQYRQILSKALAIGDILAVEQQLSAVQTEIEQLQGQQKVLADQTSFGTLTVHLSEPGSLSASTPAPSGGLSRAWARARGSVAHGFEAVIGASGGLFVFLVCAGLLILAARLAWPVVRRLFV
jgi:hypothetical protein